MKTEEPRQMVVPPPGIYGRSVMMPPMVAMDEEPDDRDLPIIDISGVKPVVVHPGKDREPKLRGELERAP
jgi:hypothetical protein